MSVIQQVLVLLAFITAIRGKCLVSMKDELPHVEPLILNPGVASGFRYPNKDGILEFSQNEQVRLVCNGRGNRFVNLTNTPGLKDVIAVCGKINQFEVSGESKRFQDLGCNHWPSIKQREIGYCLNSKISYEIGFQLDNEFIKLIELCHDPVEISTIFTRYELVKEIKNVRKSYTRPKFMGCSNRIVSCDHWYKRGNQINTIGQILGSPEIGNKYVKNEGQHYFARGHLVANADFVYGPQRRATFYYVNTAPQWQSCNARSWAHLEGAIRTYASDSNQDLIVYTGVHEIAQLPDQNNVKMNIYLGLTNNGTTVMPVPRFFWKVIYNEKTMLGTAFVEVNNPWLNYVPRSYKICNKIKRNTIWDTWTESEAFCTSYICEVDDFRAFVDFPEFPVAGILV